ncbi:hypothetical protein ALC56_05947 [Trachymyrmex septentrionalis]|uniref:Uncharacterized protein n=1 Tax=Trachymyrmex septentrionalis TaxID=34720 RepID=A0A195FHH3_9HYME|nr:hypothetical protein ALC56_05947 [Trachymyrmex septentrionalis]
MTHSRRTPVQDGRECNARYARDGSKVRQSERLMLPAQPIPRLGTWYMAPQGLSHSVSIPRAAAHAVPWEKVEAKARRQEEVKEEGQEMKEEEEEEEEVREGDGSRGEQTTELRVVKERLIRPYGFFPRWMRADKNPPCQTKTESRHAGRSEMVHADGRELVNERTRAIH